MEQQGHLSCEARIVERKQQKYYRITPAGKALLVGMKQKLTELYEVVVITP